MSGLVELEGRSALVTGGAGGLGGATVRRLVAAGMSAVVFDRDADAAAALAAEVGNGSVGRGGDVSSEDDVNTALAAAVELGPLWVVANVAGIGTIGRTLSRDGTPHDMDLFRTTFEVNVMGTFNVTRLAAAVMAGNEPDADGSRGVIVNTASIAGYEGQAGQVAYGSSKAAILGLSLPLARDLAPVGIRVCAIAPGTMATPLIKMVSPELEERLVSSIVYPKRMGGPEEFGLLVEQIVTNPYLNGENIRLDAALRFPPK